MPVYLPVIHTLISLSCVIGFMSNLRWLSCFTGQTEGILEHVRPYLLSIIQNTREYSDFVTEDLILLKVKKEWVADRGGTKTSVAVFVTCGCLIISQVRL